MQRIIYTSLLIVAFLGPSYGSNLLVNPGFEEGFTGWTENNWSIDTTNPYAGLSDASTTCTGAACTTVGDPNSAYLYQDVATTPGTTYDLSFYYDSGMLPIDPTELLVLWGNPSSPSLSTVVDLYDTNTGDLYDEYTGTVTSTSSTSQLEFLGRQDTDYYYLDNVSLTPTTAPSVPEPRSLWLLMGGCIALLVLRSRRFSTLTNGSR